MSAQAVLLPLFIQVALTLCLAAWMGASRVRAIRSGVVQPRDVALREPNWPPRVTQIANAYHNQLEIPVLFLVLTILAWEFRKADLLFVLLAWVFVVLRLLHAYIHLTSNNLPRRGLAFASSVIVLALMWVIFAVRILAPI